MLLLDSQVVLWLLDDNPRLGEQTRRLITGSEFVHVSAATVWELTIQAMLGKLTVPNNLDEFLLHQGLAGLPVTAKHAAALRDFPEFGDHDPFDRLLVAQAATERLTLVTADRVLLRAGHRFIVDATD